MSSIKIGKKKIGFGQPIFYIAEAGVNHNGSLKNAKKLIDVACEAGADAIKFQSFKTDEIITPLSPKAKYHLETTGRKTSWYDLLKSQELSDVNHKKLIEYCNKKKIIFLSTPYDSFSAKLLNNLRVLAFKIASTDNDNYPLLNDILKFDKPILISTAMTTFQEVKNIYNYFNKRKFKKIAIMQCTGSYPSKIEDSNLRVIKTYKKIFNCPIGLSDHTTNNVSALTAVGLGIDIIEKHFTLNKNMFGPDHRMSLSPKELIDSVKEIREAESSLGSYEKKIINSEKDNRKKLKKSIVAASNIRKNQIIKGKLIKVKRPGTGIRPNNYSKIIGMVAKRNIKANTLLKFNMLKKK